MLQYICISLQVFNPDRLWLCMYFESKDTPLDTCSLSDETTPVERQASLLLPPTPEQTFGCRELSSYTSHHYQLA